LILTKKEVLLSKDTNYFTLPRNLAFYYIPPPKRAEFYHPKPEKAGTLQSTLIVKSSKPAKMYVSLLITVF
jgi:hypothetical protein